MPLSKGGVEHVVHDGKLSGKRTGRVELSSTGVLLDGRKKHDETEQGRKFNE